MGVNEYLHKTKVTKRYSHAIIDIQFPKVTFEDFKQVEY